MLACQFALNLFQDVLLEFQCREVQVMVPRESSCCSVPGIEDLLLKVKEVDFLVSWV